MNEKIPQAKVAWLKQGLKILEEKGPGVLSIDYVAGRIGKTKGSFYFHFKNREQYITDLLGYFERLYPFVPLEKDLGTEQRLAYVNSLRKWAFNVPPGLEIAIRAWSQHNELVKNFQDRIDQNRLDFSYRNYIQAGFDKDDARIKSYRAYAIYIGLQQIRSLHTEEEFKKISKAVFLPPSATQR